MLSRRRFCRIGAAASSGLLLGGCNRFKLKFNSARVVVVGGGFAGATVAKYIRKLDPNISVSLIEANARYFSCPTSNWLYAGQQSLSAMQFNYRALAQRYGVQVIQGLVNAVDSERRQIRLSDDGVISYDRLVLAPGIGFRWDAIEGYDQAISDTLIPHAWKAGGQTQLLNQQLQAMADGGVVIIGAPPNPFRCPPGPYERASMMAHYLTRHNAKAKILILDPKSKFSKQALFTEGWRQHYGYGSSNSMIEWLSITDNPVIRVDAKTKTVETDFGDRYRADVLNIIPPQKAGFIAHLAGVTDASGWCPVDHLSSESTLKANIHVIGDAAVYTPLPKSAFAASSEAKSCAFAIVSQLNDQDLSAPTWINTCYSLIAPEHGISVAMVYKINADGNIIKVPGAGGVTPDSNTNTVNDEAKFARHWFHSITHDAFA